MHDSRFCNLSTKTTINVIEYSINKIISCLSILEMLGKMFSRRNNSRYKNAWQKPSCDISFGYTAKTTRSDQALLTGTPTCTINAFGLKGFLSLMMFYCDKSHRKFKILNTFNELLCYCGFALRRFIVYWKQSYWENRHISSIGCADKSFKSQHIFMFLCFWTFSLLAWKDILYRRCGDFVQW